VNNGRRYTRLVTDVNTDFLTKIGNREAFDRTFGEVFTEFSKNDRKLTFVMFDIDNFKKFNDTYGHLLGDRVLRDVSSNVNGFLKDHSTEGQFFRLGGEEFGIIFRNKTSNEVIPIMKEVSDLVNNMGIEYGDEILKISLSMGLSALDSKDSSDTNFYARVDSYLYNSKENGKKALTAEGELIKL
jgi:diguanylate cyclase (GGDEF)-like protein